MPASGVPFDGWIVAPNAINPGTGRFVGMTYAIFPLILATWPLHIRHAPCKRPWEQATPPEAADGSFATPAPAELVCAAPFA